jgi:hypothetical protein
MAPSYPVISSALAPSYDVGALCVMGVLVALYLLSAGRSRFAAASAS